jgi:hypothetical protein
MKSSGFIAASAAIMLMLGFFHLFYTFQGPNLQPRDPDLTARMQAATAVITRETTMWRIWIGINATHSLGLIMFGALYGYLSIWQRELLLRSWFLLVFGFAVLLGYAIIAKLYFFSSPFRSVVLAAVLYLIGVLFKNAA